MVPFTSFGHSLRGSVQHSLLPTPRTWKVFGNNAQMRRMFTSAEVACISAARCDRLGLLCRVLPAVELAELLPPPP